MARTIRTIPHLRLLPAYNRRSRTRLLSHLKRATLKAASQQELERSVLEVLEFWRGFKAYGDGLRSCPREESDLFKQGFRLKMVVARLPRPAPEPVSSAYGLDL